MAHGSGLTEASVCPDARTRPDASVTRSAGRRPASTRFACFDGLRAIAALLVVGVHTTFASGFTVHSRSYGEYTSRLEIGVEVFFVISGFLLYRPFVVAHLANRPDPDRSRFWIRRLKRIVPAYWLAFIVATYVLRADSAGHTWYGPLVFLGFAQIYDPHYILHGIGQAWSLDVEMAFYLMIPLYAAWLRPGRNRRQGIPTAATRSQLRVEMFGLGSLVAIGYAWRIPVLFLDGPHAKGVITIMPNWLPAYLDQFALGMLLAVASAYFEARGDQPRLLWNRAFPWVCWSAAVFCLWAVSHIGLSRNPIAYEPPGVSLARQALYGAFALLVVAPAVFGPQDRGAIRAFLRWWPMAALGVVSYGIYLWHEAWMHMFFVWTGDHLFKFPLIDIFSFVVLMAVVSATASYWLLERPIIRSAIGTKPAPPRPAHHTVSAPGRASASVGSHQQVPAVTA